MIIKLVLSAFFILYSSFSLGCEIHLPHHIVILGDVADIIKSSSHSGCNEDALTEVNETLTSVEGKISSFQIMEILKSKKHKVAVQPHLVQVQHLKHLVREQISLPSGVQLKSSSAVDAVNFLTLSPGDKVEVECSGCLFGSQQPLNIKIIGFDGNNRSVTVRANFKKMVKAYRFIGFHPAFSKIKAGSLKEVFVESIPHTDLITNLNTLKFFKLNKPVRAGDLLRLSDLNALNLVKAGVATEVIIENELVKLKTTGISRSNGTLGQIVEVFHPQKNKKYQGKVIDINKVLVNI